MGISSIVLGVEVYGLLQPAEEDYIALVLHVYCGISGLLGELRGEGLDLFEARHLLIGKALAGEADAHGALGLDVGGLCA